jgi:hypothetical protein
MYFNSSFVSLNTFVDDSSCFSCQITLFFFVFASVPSNNSKKFSVTILLPLWEIKYIKQEDVENENLIEEKKTEARTQIQRYKSSNRFEKKTDIRYLTIIFVGKRNYYIEEM